MLKPEYTNNFKNDLKIIKKRKLDINKLKKVMEKLYKEEKLEIKYRDHNLIGKYRGFKECHIEPDWLLIYQIGNGIIVFNRTGTHSDLFK